MGCTDPCSEAVRVKDASGHWKTFYVRYKLDTGGFSRIDLIFDKGSKRSFALKRILCHSKDDESKALKEANFQSNLPDHPNLLPCIASGLQHVSRREQGAISEVLLVLSYSKVCLNICQMKYYSEVHCNVKLTIDLHVMICSPCTS